MRPGRARRVALLVHRYVGLLLTVFLVVAGLTGSVLAFQQELDAALNPELLTATPPVPGAPLLDPFEVHRRLQSQLPPGLTAAEVRFDAEAGKANLVWLELGNDEWRQFFVDPYTGRLLGSRDWGNLADGVRTNLIPFLYRLHFSLALGEVGTFVFGLVALLWTIDCFVGAYLTFPVAETRGARSHKSWLSRWARAFRLRTSKLFSFVFTWHRASGLWVWGFLLVFAWSAVGLNLRSVYEPVMKTLAGLEPRTHDRLPHLPKPYPPPGLSLTEAHALGQRLMAAEAARRSFQIERELELSYHADHGAFVYVVESSLDISRRFPRTAVYFDARDGHLLGFDAPTGQSSGGTITSWINSLHFGAVFGTWYRVFVSAFGVLVGVLSVTGAVIWWRKRSKAAPESSRKAPSPERAPPLSDGSHSGAE